MKGRPGSSCQPETGNMSRYRAPASEHCPVCPVHLYSFGGRKWKRFHGLAVGLRAPSLSLSLSHTRRHTHTQKHTHARGRACTNPRNYRRPTLPLNCVKLVESARVFTCEARMYGLSWRCCIQVVSAAAQNSLVLITCAAQKDLGQGCLQDGGVGRTSLCEHFL